MTAQVPDTVTIDGTRYALCGVRGEGMFNPAEQGIETAAPHTACWRGSVCGYLVAGERLLLDHLQIWSDPGRWPRNRAVIREFFGDRLTIDEDHWVDAAGLAIPIPFTGGLLLGDGFIDGLDDAPGFHPAWTYQRVLEVTFEGGHLLAAFDRSAEMAELRAHDGRLSREETKDLVTWIDDSFRLDY